MKQINIKRLLAKGCQVVMGFLLGIILVGILLLGMYNVPGLATWLRNEFKYADWEFGVTAEDYALVYNSEDYMAYNPDLDFEEIGTSEEELFKHFKSVGMKEGRRGHKDFDVIYYREQYQDVENQCADDWRDYYEHYMEIGYAEGRLGTDDKIVTDSYTILLKSAIDDESVVFQIEPMTELEKQKLYIMQMPVYEKELNKKYIVTEVTTEDVSTTLPLQGNITDKYVLVAKAEGKYVAVSNEAYITNPEAISAVTSINQESVSKKGIHLSVDEISQASTLDLSQVICDFVINDLVNVKNTGIAYEYNGATYYFDPDEVARLDAAFEQWAKDDVVVTGRILLEYDNAFQSLYYDGTKYDDTISYYAVDTNKKSNVQLLEAFVSFFTSRYNGTDEQGRLLSNWIVGKDVNEHALMNHMTENYILDATVAEYARTFRIVYNTALKENAGVKVYVPISNRWGNSSIQYSNGGNEFIDWFNREMEDGGDINWNIAIAASSYPLNDPMVTNDNEITRDKDGNYTTRDDVTSEVLDTRFVTMQNINVFVRYMSSDLFLNQQGEVRSIIVDDLIYTSKSDSHPDAENYQVASVLYSYYKAEENEHIDGYFYRDLNDKVEGEEQTYYGIANKKSFDVFKNMDKKYLLEEWQEFLYD